jgi:regulator of sigma E protease
MIDTLVTILLVAVILVVLVVPHEFGHFLVARLARVRVHEFGIGFPPRARVLGRDKETIYTLNWLPIGGFVRLEGEDGESDDPRAFVNQPLKIRAAILLAGVAMNLLLAWVIFALIAGFSDPVTDIQLGCIQPDSPAAQIGLVGGTVLQTDQNGNQTCATSGDTILAIDGQHFPAFDDMDTGDAPIRYLRDHGGQTVTLTIRHADGSVDDRTATLRVPSPGIGALGISSYALTRGDAVQSGPLDAISTGFRRTLDASTLILKTLGQLVTNVSSLTNPPVSGPIGIVSAVGAIRTELPPSFTLWLIGLLSANLAIVNALPLPPLDGGRLALALAQRLFGSRVTASLQRAVLLAGVVALLVFLVWISYFDIQRLGSG